MKCPGIKSAYYLIYGWAVDRRTAPTINHDFPDVVREFRRHFAWRSDRFSPENHLRKNCDISREFIIRDPTTKHLQSAYQLPANTECFKRNNLEHNRC